ncbi:hypothetical protein LJC58_01610 [Lachnospiraceae bacterium OttesenSCG-928-D06]|nr:hypothetical protein [Lachnospiraceae bacterium OttesenSCG-928-D06]
MNLDVWIDSYTEYKTICKQIGKDFCRLYKSSDEHKKVFIQYCERHNANIYFRLFYMDGVSADNIADMNNIDRRTVFKNIDKESESFGIWLDNIFSLYAVTKQHYKSKLKM